MSRSATPRFATPATDRPSFGAAVADTARMLGVPFLPWQSRVTRLALEHDERGRLAYRDVAVSLPRQRGKSVIAQAVALHRMLLAPNQRVVYAAQSRLKARERLFDLWWPRIRRSPFAGMFTLGRAAGAESLRCVNGSILTLLSTEESSTTATAWIWRFWMSRGLCQATLR